MRAKEAIENMDPSLFWNSQTIIPNVNDKVTALRTECLEMSLDSYPAIWFARVGVLESIREVVDET